MVNLTVTTEGFDEFVNKISEMEGARVYAQGFGEYVSRARQIVIEGNPVGDFRDSHRGLMKRSWQQPRYSYNGTLLKATVTNSVDYGVDENYGHTQVPGTYVPEIDRYLIHWWVPGTYALETSLDNAELEWEGVIRKDVLRVWNEIRGSLYDRPMEELETDYDPQKDMEPVLDDFDEDSEDFDE